MSAQPNLRPAAPAAPLRLDIHDAYAFLIDLERRTEINIAICQSREVCARHRRDLALTQMLIDMAGKVIDQRGECRATARTRELRSRESGERMERLR
jgi:hypothetical protein